MIDIEIEQLLTFNEAAKRVPGGASGKGVHLHTVFRWTTRGCGGRVLDSVRIGGRRYTSVEALARFAADDGDSEGPPVVDDRRASDPGPRTRVVLQEAGITSVREGAGGRS
jgi:Protein of unknown function (DUF1580)